MLITVLKRTKWSIRYGKVYKTKHICINSLIKEVIVIIVSCEVVEPYVDVTGDNLSLIRITFFRMSLTTTRFDFFSVVRWLFWHEKLLVYICILLDAVCSVNLSLIDCIFSIDSWIFVLTKLAFLNEIAPQSNRKIRKN